MAQPQDPEIMTRAQTKSGMLNELNHPGTPQIIRLKNISFSGPQEGQMFMIIEEREGSKSGDSTNLGGGFEN